MVKSEAPAPSNCANRYQKLIWDAAWLSPGAQPMLRGGPPLLVHPGVRFEEIETSSMGNQVSLGIPFRWANWPIPPPLPSVHAMGKRLGSGVLGLAMDPYLAETPKESLKSATVKSDV